MQQGEKRRVAGGARRTGAQGAAAGACSCAVECYAAVSYTHLRAHETVLDFVCRLLLEKKKKTCEHMQA